MNATQLKIAAEVLTLAADEFGNHGCNDFYLANTPENYKFIQELNAVDDCGDPHITKDGTRIITQDWLVMSHLARLMKKEAQ